GAAARAEFADVEGQHFGQWAIEVGGELVGEEEGPPHPQPLSPTGARGDSPDPARTPAESDSAGRRTVRPGGATPAAPPPARTPPTFPTPPPRAPPSSRSAAAPAAPGRRRRGRRAGRRPHAAATTCPNPTAR